MADILRRVSAEMASCQAQSRAFQSQLISVQERLAQKTQSYYESQKGDAWKRSLIEGAFQLGAFGYSYYDPSSKMHEMVAAMGRAFATSIFDPRQLDNQNGMQQVQRAEGQVNRIVAALDQLRQTQDNAQQNLDQSRQAARAG